MCITRRTQSTASAFQQEREFNTVVFIFSSLLDCQRKKKWYKEWGEKERKEVGYKERGPEEEKK